MNSTVLSGRLKTGQRWLPALFFAMIIFWFSSMPGDDVSQIYTRLDTIAQPAATPTRTGTTVAPTNTASPVPATKAATATKTNTPAAPRPTATITPTATALPISNIIRKIPVFARADFLKAGHAIGYFFLGLTVLFGLRLASRWSPARAVGLCLLYAISDEFHQLFVTGRSAALNDVLIDILAALIGVICLIALSKFWAYFRKNQSPAG
jgi:hypothetical protein